MRSHPQEGVSGAVLLSVGLLRKHTGCILLVCQESLPKEVSLVTSLGIVWLLIQHRDFYFSQRARKTQ